MQKLIPNKIGLWLTTSLVVIGALFYTLSFFVLQDKVLTMQIRNNLQENLKKTGLKIEIENIHWSGWGSFRCLKIQLRDEKQKKIPFQAGRIDISFDLLSLLRNRRHPENALRKVKIIDPSIKIKRFADGTLDIKQYFPQSKKKLRLEAVFIVKNGNLNFEDQLYGKHFLKQINGNVKFNRNKTFNWDCSGSSDFNDHLLWSSSGDATTNLNTGQGEIAVDNLLIRKIAPYIPEPYSVKVYKGTGNLNLKFGWHKKRLWFESGAVRLTDTQLKIPATNELLNIEELDGRISPSELKVNKARVAYNGSLFKFALRLDTKTAAVQGTVSGDQIHLTDLPKFIPRLQPYKMEGLANLRIAVSGIVDRPVLNGELFLTGVELDLEKDLRIKGISGQIDIVENDIEIKRLEGSFGKALVGAKGKIHNIFAPTFDLTIFGTRISPAEFNLPNLNGLEIGSPIDLRGKIGGNLSDLQFTGDFQVDKLKFKELRAENVRATVGWDSLSNRIQISKLEGKTEGGSFLAKGAVKIDSSGVEWKVSGEIEKFDLNHIKFGSDLGINGKISTTAILKGKWKVGEPFEPGTILGTFKGDGISNHEMYLKDIQGVYSWNDRKLKVDSIQAHTGQGRVYGHLALDNNNLTAHFNAERIPVRELLPDAEKYPFDGLFNGIFEFNGSLSKPIGKIQCSLKQATYLSKRVGEITGNLEYENQDLNIVGLQVASDSGDYSLKGKVSWAGKPTVALTVSSDSAELDGIGKWLPLDPSLRLGGTGALNLEFSGPAENPTYAGLIQLVNPSIGNFQMEQGLVQLEGDFQEIRINRMELRDGVSSIDISGKASRDSLDLNLTGNEINLGSLNLGFERKRLQGRINIEGKLIGKPSAPLLSAEISSGYLAFGPFIADTVSGSFSLKEKELHFSRLKLNGKDFNLDIYGKMKISQPLALDMGINVFDLDITKLFQAFNISGLDVTGKLGGLIKVTGDPFQPEIRVDGELYDAVSGSVPIRGEFGLSYYRDRVSIERIKLMQNSGSLVADGVWEVGSELNLQIKAVGFSLEVFNSFLSPAHELAGTVDADTKLTFSNSTISGEIQASIDELYWNRNRLGDLQLQGRLTKQGFLIEESILTAKGGSITARGYLPWPDQTLTKLTPARDFQELSRGIDLKLEFIDTPLALANSCLPRNMAVTSGSVKGKVNLEGAYRWPVFSGQLEAADVGITTPDLPLAIENSQIALEINHNRIAIQEARGEYGDGKFALNGEVLLFGEEDQLHFNLNFNGSKLYYRNNYFDGFGNLNLQLTGSTNNSKLTGKVHVYDCKIGKLKMVKNRTSMVGWNPSFDLRVTTGKYVRYRQIGLADIIVQGDLRVGGNFKNPLISGEATSKKGVLTLYGQTFKVNKAKAIFKFTQGFKPYLDVESSVLTAKAEVFLIVKGQIGGNLLINLYSYPSLSEEDLYALLNWSELRGDKPLTVQGAASTNLSMVTDTMFGDVFYELRQALHLDYLYLEHDYIDDEFRISAGDFVSSKLFLSYSRSVSDQPKEKWGLEYYLTSNLITSGTYSLEDGTSWRLTYRFRF